MSLKRHAQITAQPSVSPLWLRWFAAYGRRYVRRHFHSVRLLNPPAPLGDGPLVIYLNHASWWDPMICLALRERFFAHRTSYAPIDGEALGKYAFFRKLGFFPVDKHGARGAIEFLRQATALLARPNAALWLTPQGSFRDVRVRPAEFRGGVAHLAQRVRTATFLPLAIEYVFWEERLPEVCVHFGAPLHASELCGTIELITRKLESSLEDAQDALAAAVIRRDAQRLRPLMQAEHGVGGVYDWWRQAKALWRGEQFKPEHGSK